MKNGYIETYKNYRIIKAGEDFVITDKHGTTKGQTTTEEDAKAYIDYITQQQEEEQRTFDSLKELNKNTSKAQQYINNYNYASGVNLRDVYGSYSDAKQNAFNYCFDIYTKLKGYQRRIATYNKNVFTFAFEFDFDGAKYLCYITPSQDYKIKIDD